MQRKLYVAHADGDDEIARKLADELKDMGYGVEAQTFLLVGDSSIAHVNNVLSEGLPIVLCVRSPAQGADAAGRRRENPGRFQGARRRHFTIARRIYRGLRGSRPFRRANDGSDARACQH